LTFIVIRTTTTLNTSDYMAIKLTHYFQNPNIWFPPRNILYHYAKIEDCVEGTQKEELKIIGEVLDIAKFFATITGISGKQYYLQESNEEPDDILATRLERNEQAKLKCYGVQHTKYGKYSTENLITQMKRTKFSGKYKYNILVCVINKDYELKSVEKIHKELILENNSATTEFYLFGRTKEKGQVFTLWEILPEINRYPEINLISSLLNSRLPIPKVQFTGGFEPKKGEKILPFLSVDSN